MNSPLAPESISSAPNVEPNDSAVVVASPEPSTVPTDFYYHSVSVIEFRLREFLDNRIYSPDPDSPLALKELTSALNSIKSAVDTRLKIAQLEKQSNSHQPKPIHPKSIQPQATQPPAPNPKPLPTQPITSQQPLAAPSEIALAQPTPSSHSTATAQPPESSNATHTEQLSESPTSAPSELHSSNFTLHNSSSSSSPSLRFQISEAARIRYLKERQYQLTQKSRKRSAAKGRTETALSPSPKIACAA